MILLTNHFKINKYDEFEDYSYKNVYSIIKKMIKHAMKKIQRRLKRKYIQTTNVFLR